jgi:hypothetical protein
VPKSKKIAARPRKKAPARKPAGKNKPGAGRPRVILNAKKIGKLAFAGCKNSEIAFILGCDDETLTNNYSRILDKKRAERKAKLRTAQTFKAMMGDTTMLIWLGKQELEQTDKQMFDGNLRHTHQLSMEDLQGSLSKYGEASE